MRDDGLFVRECPFCGGAARTFQYNGTLQATCDGDYKECAGTDVMAPVAMWNHRYRSEPMQEFLGWIRAMARNGEPTRVEYNRLDLGSTDSYLEEVRFQELQPGDGQKLAEAINEIARVEREYE